MNNCLNCGKEVKNKYCDNSCRFKHKPSSYKPTQETINKLKLINSNKWKVFKVICFKCGIEFEVEEFDVDEPKKEKYFCTRSCANSKQHSNETKEKIRKVIKENFHIYNKNQIQYQLDRRMLKICPICKKDFSVPPVHKNKIYCSKGCYLKDTKHIYRKQTSGGYRKGSGRGKSGWYKGYWSDSSWELVWIIYNIDHDIHFVRNKEGFEYFLNNKRHLYYPDFIVDNVYIEIKGYDTVQSRLKYENFNKPLIILKKNDLKHIFKYVVDKYGSDFIKLYENNPYIAMTNICKVCGEPCKVKNVYCSRKCAGIGNNRNSKFK